MKRFLLGLLAVLTLGLCAVCTVQWTREAKLHGIIQRLSRDLQTESKARMDAEEQVARFEEEIARLTKLRDEAEARLLAAMQENKALVEDQSARGYSIAVLMNQARRAEAELAAIQQVAGQGADAIKDRNAEVTAQNAAIAKANSQIKQLAAERDDAIARLNNRTREFNELVEKFNKLAKQR